MPAVEHINFPSQPQGKPIPGRAGLPTQLPGGATTVSRVAAATGDIRPGGLIETDK